MAASKIPTGKYDLISSDNFDAYLTAIGVGLAKRAIASTMKPTVEILQGADGTFTINTYSTLKNTTIKFKPGVEFDEETADGRTAKSVVTIDGNKMTHIQRIGKLESKVTREFNGDEMIAVFVCADAKSTRKYKKVKYTMRKGNAGPMSPSTVAWGPSPVGGGGGKDEAGPRDEFLEEFDSTVEGFRGQYIALRDENRMLRSEKKNHQRELQRLEGSLSEYSKYAKENSYLKEELEKKKEEGKRMELELQSITRDNVNVHQSYSKEVSDLKYELERKEEEVRLLWKELHVLKAMRDNMIAHAQSTLVAGVGAPSQRAVEQGEYRKRESSYPPPASGHQQTGMMMPDTTGHSRGASPQPQQRGSSRSPSPTPAATQRGSDNGERWKNDPRGGAHAPAANVSSWKLFP